MTAPFRDRSEAGRVLSDRLDHLRDATPVVLALPRGGVPVGYEVARALDAPLDVFVVRKLGTPGHRELAMGAIASGGVRVINRDVVESMRISDVDIEAVTREEERELERRETAYRGERAALDVEGRTVIIVDDGLATGSSMRAAVAAIRQRRPAKVVVAVPTGARQTCQELQAHADEVVCAASPEPFYAVGLSYRDFSQTSDSEVAELLERAQTMR